MHGILSIPLQEGDTIGIVAPSSPLQKKILKKG
ncbi:Uncharacterised protein [Legionella feeleii]|uniref:Uncharacterized protein n=1 Tax=Legionella feeleii TaxID=453 RepID=A0A378IYA8_9GAMM|nr:Uncharacterised protein [Legionella feeleii]